MSSEPDVVSSRSAAPAPPDAERGPLLVRLPDAPFATPSSCACCGADATTFRALRAGGGREISIGYCAECALHAARLETRRLAGALAAALIGAAFAFALPIARPWLSLPATVALALGAVLLPLGVVAVGGRAAKGHAARGPAARLDASNALVCARAAWARELGARIGAAPEPAPKSFTLPLGPCALVVLVAGVVAPLSHTFQHPWVRILNLGDTALEVHVDGRALGRVEPSSSESPLAGLEVRVPAGRRRFSSHSPGAVLVVEHDVRVHAGERHLYAAVAPTTCFWLERTTYGRERAGTETVPLVGAERFWVVPEEVQGWFVPSPTPAADVRATGGITTVLRQGPCEGAH